MTTEQIDIRIREDGSRVVSRNIEGIGSSSRKAADGVDFLKKALGFLAAAFAVDKIIQYADAWSAAAGQIRIATTSTAEAKAVTDELFKAAQNTRTAYTDIVELYARSARAGKELGASQQQLIQFTENVGKSLAVQGVSATVAKGALMQLGQALGGNIIRAEEFNSVLEGAPYILTTVSKNIKGVDGSIANLRARMLAGKLTSKEFFDAFLKGSGDIEKDFAKSSFTIGQSFTIIENALTRFIGELDQKLGVSSTVGTIAKFIILNFEQIGNTILSIGAAIAVAFTPTIVLAFASAVRSLFALLAANPFTALAGAIAAVAMYLTLMRDQIKAGIDDTTTLGDVFRALGEQIGTAFVAATNIFMGLVDLVVSTYQTITSTTSDATGAWTKSYEGFYAGVGDGFAGVVRAIARTLDAIAGLLTGLGIAIVRTFSGLPDVLGSIFKRAQNVVVGVIEDMINETIGAVNKLRSLIGQELIEKVSLTRADVNESFFKDYGANIASSIDAGFQSQGGFVEKWVNDTFARAQQIGKDRAAKLGGQAAVDLSKALGKPGAAVDPNAAKEAKKLENALQSLLDKISPVDAAIREQAEAEKILDRARKAGLITATQQAQYLVQLKQYYKDIIDPIGKVNRELSEQTMLLGLSAKAREVESQFLGIQKDLLSQGITLTQAETVAMRDKLTALQALNEAVQAQDQLLANSVGQRTAFEQQLTAMQTLLQNPSSGFTGGDAAQNINQMQPDLFAGTQTAIDANLAAYQNMYTQIDALRAKNLITEQTAATARARIDIMANEQRLKGTQDFFSTLATLSQSGNKKVAAIGKAAALVQATIDGVLAVQKALASPPGWPYNAPQVIAVGLQAAANVATIAGFETGGYTGNGGTGRIAGVVHGQEYVVNAEATKRNRAALEAMNSGGTLRPDGQQVSIVINNNASGTEATTRERQTPNGREIEVTIAAVVRKDIKSGGPISADLESQYALNRAAGTTR